MQYTFEDFLKVIARLRAPGGCPWDAEQTHESIKKNLIEEAYEATEAIDSGKGAKMADELGDLLLHIVFYSKLADEQNAFDYTDVANAVCDKLIYRHPHVYGDIHADTPEAVKQNWEALKLRKKNRKSGTLGGVPVSLPSMVKAFRIGEKAAATGFDWEQKEDVWAKVKEELMEVDAELRADDKEHLTDEMGDLFFALVNACRLYGIDPEAALERTNKKFIRRFNHLEKRAEEKGVSLHDMSLAEMDSYWNEAKELENK